MNFQLQFTKTMKVKFVSHVNPNKSNYGNNGVTVDISETVLKQMIEDYYLTEGDNNIVEYLNNNNNTINLGNNPYALEEYVDTKYISVERKEIFTEDRELIERIEFEFFNYSTFEERQNNPELVTPLIKKLMPVYFIKNSSNGNKEVFEYNEVDKTPENNKEFFEIFEELFEENEDVIYVGRDVYEENNFDFDLEFK